VKLDGVNFDVRSWEEVAIALRAIAAAAADQGMVSDIARSVVKMNLPAHIRNVVSFDGTRIALRELSNIGQETKTILEENGLAGTGIDAPIRRPGRPGDALSKFPAGRRRVADVEHLP